MELAAAWLMKPLLEEEQRSMGVAIDVTHNTRAIIGAERLLADASRRKP